MGLTGEKYEEDSRADATRGGRRWGIWRNARRSHATQRTGSRYRYRPHQSFHLPSVALSGRQRRLVVRRDRSTYPLSAATAAQQRGHDGRGDRRGRAAKTPLDEHATVVV